MQTAAHDTDQMGKQAPYFYAVALPKFVALWLGTGGFYGLFWFHQHWQTIRSRQGGDFKPWHRMLLAGSYCEPLLRLIVEARRDQATDPPFSPRARAVVWLLMTATLLLGPPLSLLCPFAFLPLVDAQRLANQVNALRTPAADENADWSHREWLALLPAGLALLAGVGWLVHTGWFSDAANRISHR